MAFAAPLASADVHAPYLRGEHRVAPRGVVLIAQKKISPSEAKSIARKRVRGADVIDLSFDGKTYKVRMQKKNGRVVDVYVDAATGRVR